MKIEILLAFLFGVTFLGVLTYAALREQPIHDERQFFLLRVIAAISAAACAAIVPGFLDVQIGIAAEIAVRAGGAIAVFVLIYLLNPPKLSQHHSEERQVNINNFNSKEFHEGDSTITGGNSSPLKLIFTNSQDYPSCSFSIVNNSRSQLQITGLRVIKASSIKVEYDDVRHLMGARVNLNVDLRAMSEGAFAPILNDQVSNLDPGEAEAFNLKLTAENSINLVDLEIEYVAPYLTEPGLKRPEKLIFVSTPVDSKGWPGSIQLLERNQCLEAVLEEKPPPLAYPATEFHQGDILLLLLRGFAHICWDNLQEYWDVINDKYYGTKHFGLIAASFAELGKSRELPSAITESLENWLADPNQLSKSPVWDDESHALIVQDALLQTNVESSSHDHSAVPDNIKKILSLLDSNVLVTTMFQDDQPNGQQDQSLDYVEKLLGEVTILENRKALLRKIIDLYSIGCIEFLIVNLRVSFGHSSSYEELLYECLEKSGYEFSSSESEIQNRWSEWWSKNRNKKMYRQFKWYSYCPRLAKACEAMNAGNVDTLLSLAKDSDPIVRLAVSRNPNINTEVVSALVGWPEVFIRLSLAENPEASSEFLRILALDESSYVRRWVACNRNTDPETISLLADDKSSAVREFLNKRTANN